MYESFIYNTEEKILTYEISDAALEIAAGFMKDIAVSLTIAYCTFDFCNAIGPKGDAPVGDPFTRLPDPNA
jgi:hypothetical protein